MLIFLTARQALILLAMPPLSLRLRQLAVDNDESIVDRGIVGIQIERLLEFAACAIIALYTQQKVAHGKVRGRIFGIRFDAAGKQILFHLLFTQALVVFLRAFRLLLIPEPSIDLIQAEVE